MIIGIPRMSMKTHMTAVNWRRLGLRYLGQLSTSPTIRDSRMQNWESNPRARSMRKKQMDQRAEGASCRTTSGYTRKARPGPRFNCTIKYIEKKLGFDLRVAHLT